MTDKLSEPSLMLPFLAPVYARFHDIAYAVMRAASGGIMAFFGWGKLFNGDMPRDIELFQQLGLEPAIPLAYFTSILEFIGGIAIAIGLFTRPLAFMLFIQMIVILVMVMIPRSSGFQLSTVWFGVFMYLSVAGSGRLSLDRLIGKQF
ncbi:DoxX family protein [Pseudochrobactrum algeriensis]|uniref:DoxX family protein n=1 Tax=Pseudochrobactrum algeriensis TaxID=2834768 RepID=UPI001BCDD069|nr:DoxX family protein [Pseudochrobactrum algeriensis]MBX8813799.1 DoxX family protein [Ochrobactrum sp. MR34]QVQ36659.1 DoxX family protein [Pseudochrobactrum algeriensis]QVQ39874.1 DoxX family protein [Pseudochrobactrum algeriensis]QVQ43796.1 DoxX family protein [Pseudochrobactrum algeriensis]